MMPHYRGMTRGVCAVAASFGSGAGHAMRLVRFKPGAEGAAALQTWLLKEALPPLRAKRGIAGVHLLQGAATPQMTNEQRIRGAADAGVDWALLLVGYGEPAPAFDHSELARRGATGIAEAAYRLDCSLGRGEAG
jgi:hypothetical protein